MAKDPDSPAGSLNAMGKVLIQAGAPERARARSGRATASSHRAADETLQLGFGYPEVGAELARRWQLPQVLRDAIAFQARPLQAPEGKGYALIVAQAVAVAEVLHENAGDSKVQDLGGPLFASIDLEQLTAVLPSARDTAASFSQAA